MSTTPTHILTKLRQRSGLNANDTSMDGELNALGPLEKLRAVAGWEMGDPAWADQFLTWAKDCGIELVDPR